MPPPTPPAPVVSKPKGALVKAPAVAVRKPVAIDVRLLADYNHKGKVEDSDSNYNLRGTFPGAILFFACRASDKKLSSFKIHAEEPKIFSGHHLTSVTTVKLVHKKGLQKGDEVFIWADSAEADKIMMYEGAVVNAKAILGKGIATEAKIKLPTAPGSSLFLTLCAVAPPSAPKEAVRLNVKVMRAGVQEFKDTCLFSIAPWLMPSTNCNAEEVYVVKVDLNKDFRKTLKSQLAAVGVPLLELTPGDGTSKTAGGNHWTQDMFELGCLLKKGSSLHATINSANSEVRDFFAGVWDDFLDRGHGMIRQPQGGESMDSFGNLEVTPPLPRFPLGRKFFGVRDTAFSSGHTRGMKPQVRTFLTATPYQPATLIPTNWLAVGHVDEFLSIVPVKGSATGFRVLYASPKRAKMLCADLKAAGLGARKICAGKPPDGATHFEISVDDFLADAGGLLTLNDKLETVIKTRIVDAILLPQWGIPAAHFIPIPTIFNGTLSGALFEDCIARTGGMVNCLVLGPDRGRIIMPKPFGPLNAAGKDAFEVDAAASVKKATSMLADFIDDWDPYHVLMGEVHCGTNTKRTPKAYLEKWWDPKLEIDGKKVNA